MEHQAVNFKNKLGFINEQWSPKVIAEMNDYQFKVVKIQGKFVWHDHKDTDELIQIESFLNVVRCWRGKARRHSLQEERDVQSLEGLRVTEPDTGHAPHRILFIYTVF